MANRIAYFEIVGDDAARLREFYGKAFGWDIDQLRTPGYARIDEGAGIPGGIREEKDEPPDKVFYVQVPDLNAALRRIEDAGGQIMLEPTEMPGVTFALFRDPGGNMMGLVKE
ncbi:MAG TPA: VOC family protein [Longimicrobiales bacterium]|nr:VOC family protein [Longimicrobiales bacterium]